MPYDLSLAATNKTGVNQFGMRVLVVGAPGTGLPSSTPASTFVSALVNGNLQMDWRLPSSSPIHTQGTPPDRMSIFVRFSTNSASILAWSWIKPNLTSPGSFLTTRLVDVSGAVTAAPPAPTDPPNTVALFWKFTNELLDPQPPAPPVPSVISDLAFYGYDRATPDPDPRVVQQLVDTGTPPGGVAPPLQTVLHARSPGAVVLPGGSIRLPRGQWVRFRLLYPAVGAGRFLIPVVFGLEAEHGSPARDRIRFAHQSSIPAEDQPISPKQGGASA